MTFNEYLNRVRVNKAKELLRRRELRMTDISLAVGYMRIRVISQGVQTCGGDAAAGIPGKNTGLPEGLTEGTKKQTELKAPSAFYNTVYACGPSCFVRCRQ